MRKNQLIAIIPIAMRVIIIQVCILTFVLTSYAKDAKGQEILTKKISLSAQNIKLKDVIQQIQTAADVNFIFSSKVVDVNKKVSFNVTKKSLGQVLDEILTPLGIQYKVIDGEIVLFSKTDKVEDAFSINVHGTVTDLAGVFLPGATVQVKGTNTKTVTNDKGFFALSVVNTDAVLVISYVGYTEQEVSVANNTEFNIKLQAAPNGLNDVIVIGYGERKKKDVTGAISTVSAKDIEKSTSMTPELALQGRAAGVFVESGGGEPQARPTIRIRGVNTFGYSEPLYVIDGVPVFEGGAGVTSGGIGDSRSPINIFSLVNPNDIESMTVLKDASAAAIYGVQAGNGVILITTKKGKAGKPHVDVYTTYGVQNIPKTKSVLNTKQYFDLVTEAYNNNPDMDNGNPVTIGNKFGPLYDPTGSQYLGNAPTYDWQNELIHKNALLQDYSVKVSGGNDATTYYFSAGYSKTQSPLKANHLERYSIATNVESRLSKYIQMGLNIRLVQANSLDNTQADLGTMMSTPPFQPFYDKNDKTGFAPVAAGSFVPNPDYDPNSLNPGPLYNFASGDPRLLWGPQTRFNAFAFQALNSTEYELMQAFGNAFVQVEPVTGLRIRGSLEGQYYFNLRKQWGSFDSWRFSQTPGNPYSGNDGNSKGSYGERQGRTSNLNKELLVNYNHTFNQDHNIDITLNASQQFGRWVVSDLSGQVNYADPQYRGITNQPPYTQGFEGINWEDALIGYLARVSYKYKDRYYLDGTYRRDGSSRLAPGHKWDNFYAFAGAWRISGEKFFPKVNFLNDLKIRGGYGILGNYQSAGFYEFLSTVSTTPDYPIGSGNGDPFGSQTQGAALPGFANTTLTWEKDKTTSIGFDAVLFNNHLSFTAEYYNKLTYGIIQSVSLPPNTGIQNPADLNIAQVRNRGIELQASYNQKFGDIDFTVSGNITTVNNKVVKLYGGTPLGGELGRIEEGMSMFYLWGYKEGGIFQNQAQIDEWRKTHADVSIGQSLGNTSNGYQYKPGDMYFQDVYGNPRDGIKEQHSPGPDSLINSNDRTYLGKTIPGYYYGFTLGANYKGFDINVFFQGVGDVQKYNGVRSGLESMGGLANQWTSVLDRWTTSHPSTTMPRAVYGDPAASTRTSSRFVENAGYLRLKNLQIGYTIPKTVLSKLSFISNLRLYVSSINLFTITKYTGLDPENDVIPPTRQFLFGVNASF